MGKALFWATEIVGEALVGWGIGTIVSNQIEPNCNNKIDKIAVNGTSFICTYVLCRKWHNELHEVFDGLGAFDK